MKVSGLFLLRVTGRRGAQVLRRLADFLVHLEYLSDRLGEGSSDP